jgi:hypothetical protein
MSGAAKPATSTAVIDLALDRHVGDQSDLGQHHRAGADQHRRGLHADFATAQLTLSASSPPPFQLVHGRCQTRSAAVLLVGIFVYVVASIITRSPSVWIVIWLHPAGFRRRRRIARPRHCAISTSAQAAA